MSEPDLSLWRIVFDIATGSMNFGSGFLDDEEVAALRAAAVILGADPDDATPDNFKCKYRGHHRASLITIRPYFDGVDGLPRNQFLGVDSYPPGTRLKHAGPRLGMLQALVLYMWCPDCGRQWGALDDMPDPRMPVVVTRP